CLYCLYVFSSASWCAVRSPLFPYTTLFRSGAAEGGGHEHAQRADRSGDADQAAGQGVGAFGVDAGETEAEEGVIDPGHAPSLLRSEEHTSELQSRFDLVCRLLLEKKKNKRL